ncbi:MAG TPA: PIN domain-containing protein [Nostocaceae cyanobacterium]|nr:PIN domain-containing protein [Nostocaceae cyanobacterium]
MAKGQDDAETLLPNLPSSVHIAIPNICFIEALNTYRIDKKKRQDFITEQIKNQINELNREKTSINALSLIKHLNEASIDTERLINDIQNRLFDTIDKLLTRRAELINLNSDLIRYSAETAIFQPEIWLIKNDLMDNLILQCILEHSNSYPEAEKVFLSGNTNDFGKQEVQEALKNAGIRYSSKTKNFLGWLNSRSLS